MQSEVMFAGFGGQGIMTSGKILANAAMEEGLNVVWIPSYGPEMRGGTAYCTVFVSDGQIGSPVIKNPMHLVAMNRPSLEKFAPLIKPEGIILINSSLIDIDSGRDDVDELILPVNEIAQKIGSVKAANVVALSAFVFRSKIIGFRTLCKCIRAHFSKKQELIPLFMEAARRGKKAARKDEDK